MRAQMSGLVRCACALALCLIVAVLWCPPAASAAGSLSISPSRVIAGENLQVKGSLPGMSRPVILERKQGKSWSAVARGKSSKKGAFTFRVRARSATTTYRVRAPRVRISGRTYKEVVTPSRKVTVQKQSASLNLPAEAVQDSEVIAVASFTPTRKGRAVVLETLDAGSWSTVSSSVQSGAGRASFVVPSDVLGEETYRVRTAASGGAAAVVSPPKTLTIIEPPSPLPAPSDVGGARSGADAVVEWSEVAGAEAYRLERAAAANGPWAVVERSDAAVTREVLAVNPGGRVFVRVRSIDDEGRASTPSPVVELLAGVGQPSCGTITQDRLWTAGTVVVGCDVAVADGATLHLLGGVLLKGVDVTVRDGGRLVVWDHGASPAVFTARCDASHPAPDPGFTCPGGNPELATLTVENGAELDATDLDLNLAVVNSLPTSTVALRDSDVSDSTVGLQGVVRVTDSAFERSRLRLENTPAGPVVTGNTFTDARAHLGDDSPGPAVIANHVDMSSIEDNVTVGVGVQRVIEAENVSRVEGTWELDGHAEGAVFHLKRLRIVDGGELVSGPGSLAKIHDVDVEDGGKWTAAGESGDPALLHGDCVTAVVEVPPVHACPGLRNVRVLDGGTATWDHAVVRGLEVGGQPAVGVDTSSVTIRDSSVVESGLDLHGVVRVMDSAFEASRLRLLNTPVAPVVTGNTFSDARALLGGDGPGPAVYANSLDVSSIEDNVTVGVGVQRAIEADNSSRVEGVWELDGHAGGAVFHLKRLRVVDGGELVAGPGSLTKIHDVDVEDGGTWTAAGESGDPALLHGDCVTAVVEVPPVHDCPGLRNVRMANGGTVEWEQAVVSKLAITGLPVVGVDTSSVTIRDGVVTDSFLELRGETQLTDNDVDRSRVVLLDNPVAAVVTGNTFTDARLTPEHAEPAPAVYANHADVSGIEDNVTVGEGVQRVIEAGNSSRVEGTWNLGPAADATFVLDALTVESGGRLSAVDSEILVKHQIAVHGGLEATETSFAGADGGWSGIHAHDQSEVSIAFSSFANVGIAVVANAGCGILPVESDVTVIGSTTVGMMISNCPSDGTPEYPRPTASGNVGAYSSHVHECFFEPDPQLSYPRVIQDVEWEVPSDPECLVGYEEIHGHF